MADPFACFGDDDDSDDGNDAGNIPSQDDNITSPTGTNVNDTDGPSSSYSAEDANRERARRLMENYANKAKNNFSDPPKNSISASSDANTSYHLSFRSSYQDQKERTAFLPWPRYPPLYLGPMSLSQTQTEGGGRGYTATQDLPPGTCVLIEQPFVKGWSDEQMGRRLGLESVRHLLGLENAGEIVRCMEELHPRKKVVDAAFTTLGLKNSSSLKSLKTIEKTSLEKIEPLDRIQIFEMMSELERDANHTKELKSLLKLAQEREIINSDGSPLQDQDINRILLTMRYNGFDSGLYLHFSMFNHDEDPNCIKFRPLSGEDEGQASNNLQQQLVYSEARTTRFVKKGDALTLHYLENPREVSHATRRKILWDQHRFDVGGENDYRTTLHLNADDENNSSDEDITRRNGIFESELVDGKFPQSSLDEPYANCTNDNSTPSSSNIEKSLDDLEDIFLELKEMAKSPNSNSSSQSSLFDRAAALELTTLELITASQPTLSNTHHILLSRCRRLHLDSVELLLSHCSNLLTSKQSTELMLRFLPSAQSLLESQKRRLGKHHPDVARTYQDLSMGIQALLGAPNARKRLVLLKLDGMRTVEECSRMEFDCRRAKERIEGFYPKDVDEILDGVKSPEKEKCNNK